jgi:pimeloyl-ACP methyl ester carboxylesterase
MSIHFRKCQNNGTNVRFKQGAAHLFLNLLWGISPAAAVNLVKKHVFNPINYHLSPAQKAILNTGLKFEVTIHGKTVCGWKWGDGPGVLLVHGWNGCSAQFSYFFKPLRQMGCTVIAFDAPGHGLSEGKTSSYFEFTDAVRAFLKLNNGFSVDAIIGHSLGGSAVINALCKENRSIPSVLIAPAVQLKEILDNTFKQYGIPTAVHQKVIQEFEERFGYSLEKDNPDKLLPLLKKEILIIHDRNDPAIPYKDSEKAADKWSNVQLVETRGLGHKRILTSHNTVEFITNYIVGRISAAAVSKLETLDRSLTGRPIGEITSNLP